MGNDVLKGRSVVLRQEEPLDPLFDLYYISDYYSRRLFDHKDAIEYLESWGVNEIEIIGRYKIGYVDGSIKGIVSENRLSELKKLFDDRFNDSCIVPMYDADLKVSNIYVVNIYTGEVSKQNENFNIFNLPCISVYDKIIVCSDVFATLKCLQTGVNNAVCCIDDNYDDLVNALSKNRVSQVILKFCDYELKDMILDGIDRVEVLIDAGDIQGSFVNTHKERLSMTKESDQFVFHSPDLIYRISSFKGNGFKVNIKVESDDFKFPDSLDLYSSRSRDGFCSKAAFKFKIEPNRLERDLLYILDELEAQKNINHESVKANELSDEDKELGLKFLKGEHIFDEIVDDISKLGYIGEDLNKLLVYLAASSRKMNDPISILILSQSAAGKSYLVDTVKRLMPVDDVLSITSLSDQALNYIENLTHKLLVFGEAVHNETIEHQIREMLSSKELSRLVTVKDEKTGRMVSQVVKKEVLVSSVMSSTNHKLNPENLSRFFVINADESVNQTKRIHESQRNKYTLERYHTKKFSIPQIIHKHRVAQELLKNITIVNDFGHYLEFPDTLMRTRRDHERFIDLIAVVCFVRQYQKEKKRSGNIEYIECDLTDYKTAYDLMVNNILPSTMNELPKSAVLLYDMLLDILGKQALDERISVDEKSFTQRDVRELTGMSQSFVKQNLRILVDFEFVRLLRGGQERTKGFYRLTSTESIKGIDLSVIPTPDEVGKKLQNPQTGQTGYSGHMTSYDLKSGL